MQGMGICTGDTMNRQNSINITPSSPLTTSFPKALPDSHMLQIWFGFTMPAFPGSAWIAPIFALIIFIY